MQMLMLVIDDPELLDDVLDAWRAIDVRGATIVESSGLHRRGRQMLGARYAMGFPRLAERVQAGHYTLFVIVADGAEAQRCLDAAEAVMGDLDQPNTGVVAAWELTLAKGMTPASGADDKKAKAGGSTLGEDE